MGNGRSFPTKSHRSRGKPQQPFLPTLIKEITMNKHFHQESHSAPADQPTKAAGLTRRDLIKKTSLALAAGSITLPSLLGGKAGAAAPDDDLKLAPRYYPLRNFRPQINLSGKL